MTSGGAAPVRVAFNFLVACTRLYKRLRPSVGPSVAVSSEHATYGDRPCFHRKATCKAAIGTAPLVGNCMLAKKGEGRIFMHDVSFLVASGRLDFSHTLRSAISRPSHVPTRLSTLIYSYPSSLFTTSKSTLPTTQSINIYSNILRGFT